ncbi:MAG: hypothetical protein IKA22_13275 [Lentisphaeria bacterium]|nr:hypothetical protein [Lentisphaeria bacterium]
MINKFKIEDFQLSEGLEAILCKGNRWRVWLVWICGILFILNCALYGKVEWLMDIKYPWTLLLFFASIFIYAVRLPGRCPLCKCRMTYGCFTKRKHCIIIHYCPNCRIYGKNGVKL